MTDPRIRLTSFRESRVRLDEAGVAHSDDPALTGAAWHGALAGFDGMRMACRVDESMTGGQPIDGPFAPLPGYRGAGELVRRLPRLVRSIRRLVGESQSISVRVPGPIGLIATASAVLQRRLVIAEVVGDVADVIDSGAGGRASRACRPLIVALTKWQVRRASVVRYVTESALQREYPARAGVPTIGLSEVRIDDMTVDAVQTVEASLVAVGSHEQLYKGHDVLIRALVPLIERHPTVSLTLIGDGSQRPYLEALCVELGVADRVRFTGFIADRRALQRRVAEHALFVMPSRTEGLPRALIEAMAWGVPSIGTRVGGIPELLPDEALVPPDDVDALVKVIDTFLTSPERRAELAAECLRRARRYSPQQVTARRGEWVAAVDAAVPVRTPAERAEFQRPESQRAAAEPTERRERSYLGSVTALLLSSGTQVAASLLAAVLSTAFLPIDQRGLMVLALTIAVLVATLSSFGVGNVLRSRIPRAGQAEYRTLRSSVAVTGAMSIVATMGGSVLATFVVSRFADERLAEPRMLVAVAALSAGQVVISMLTEIRYAHGRFDSGSRWSAAAAAVSLGGVAVGLLVDLTAVTVVAFQAGATLVVAALSLAAAARSGLVGFEGLGRWADVTRLLATGVQTLAFPLGILFLSRVDRLVLGALTNAEAVAVFALAATAAETVRIVPTAMGQILTREVAAGATWNHIRQRISTGVLLTAATALAVVVASTLLIVPLFGEQYAQAVKLVPILAIAEVIYAVIVLSQLGLIGGGWTKPALGLGTLAIVASAIAFPVGIFLGFTQGLAIAKVVVFALVAVAAYTTLSARVRAEARLG